MNILILEKIAKILNTMKLQKIRKKIGQMFCPHQAFCHLHQNQGLDLNLLVFTNYIFVYLSWLRLDSQLKHTAWLFNLSKSAASRCIITWANFIYFKLGCVPIWRTKDSNWKNARVFKSHPNTRLITDCTELFCQKPSSLTIQSSLLYHYKHHVPYKVLVGISPFGAITFISELYDGSTSHVEIVKRCGILSKELWGKDDDVMADRGFAIKNSWTM